MYICLYGLVYANEIVPESVPCEIVDSLYFSLVPSFRKKVRECTKVVTRLVPFAFLKL